MSDVSATPEAFSLNPWDPNFRRDPYPFYRPLYGGPPPVFTFRIPIAVIGRYADAVAVLRDHQRFSSTAMREFTQNTANLFGRSPTVVTSDPPVHTRLRRLVSRDFTPRRIRELDARIREITMGLLDRVEERGGFELMGDLAVPLPV